MGTYELLIGEAEAKDAIRKTEFRTDVIGSNTRLAGAGLEMIDLPGRESRLRKALASVQKDYDFIFVDCPPSLDLLTLNGLCACDSVLIPIQCEYFGTKVYKTTIPRTIRISEAPSYGQPINFYEPKGKGSEAYMDLAIEFVKNNRPHEPARRRTKGNSAPAEQKGALEQVKQGEA